MKVRPKGILAFHLGGKTGEVLDFRLSRMGFVIFRVVWLGEPGIHEVAAADVEVVR